MNFNLTSCTNKLKYQVNQNRNSSKQSTECCKKLKKKGGGGGGIPAEEE